jgi:hypothetical protein
MFISVGHVQGLIVCYGRAGILSNEALPVGPPSCPSTRKQQHQFASQPARLSEWSWGAMPSDAAQAWQALQAGAEAHGQKGASATSKALRAKKGAPQCTRHVAVHEHSTALMSHSQLGLW